MTATAPDVLFVYGSLKSSLAHPMGERLRQQADLLGAAHVAGRLYRVSWYPGATFTSWSTDVVHGEAYRLHDPATALAWLDSYEGLTQGPESVATSDEYARRIVDVALDDGRRIKAWMYVWRRPTSDLELIPSGRWTG